MKKFFGGAASVLGITLALAMSGGCTGFNPDYVTQPVSCAQATPEQKAVWCATDGGTTAEEDGSGDAAATATDMAAPTCPVKVGDVTTKFVFHPDQKRCPGMVSLPKDGQGTDNDAAVWVKIISGTRTVFIAQPYTGAATADWTWQPGNQTFNGQPANHWKLVGVGVVSAYSPLSMGGSAVGFDRLVADQSKLTVVREACPNQGVPGFCYPWQ